MSKVWYHPTMNEKSIEQFNTKKVAKKFSWYKATESMLYNYKSFSIRIMSLLQQLELVRRQLEPSIIAKYEIQEGKTYSVSSPIETSVINRIEGDAVQKLEQAIKNIETMKEIVEVSMDTMLDSEQKKLVKLIYFEKRSWQYSCQELLLDKNTYYVRKNEIVKVLAWCFGYLPDEEAESILGIFMDQALWQKAR